MAKKEQYITKEKNKSGTVFRLRIRAYGQEYHESFKASDYGSEKIALEAAKQIRNEKLLDMQAGRQIRQLYPTVAELYQKKFDLFKCRKKTRDKHDYFYQYIQPLGDMQINEVTAADVQETINEYSRTHSYEATRRVRGVWSQIYRTALMLGYDVIDRSQQIVLPQKSMCKPVNHRDQSLIATDFDDFCDALLQYHDYDEDGRYKSRQVWYALQIMSGCGLRPAETFALRKDDILFIPYPHIAVRASIRSTEDEYNQVSATKTGKSVRDVPVPDWLVPVLRQLKDEREDFLFTDPDGAFWDIDELSDYIHRVSVSCGIPFNMYRLRHKFSTDLYHDQVNPVAIRDLMGHESESVTMDYAVSSEEERQEAVRNRKYS